MSELKSFVSSALQAHAAKPLPRYLKKQPFAFIVFPNKKRGRPATGRKKDGVLYLRMPKHLVPGAREVVNEWLAKQATSKADDNPDAVKTPA